jgi:TPR repeat protein
MPGDMPLLGQDGRRRARGWQFGGLVLSGIAVAAVVVLELWARPPDWLRGPRAFVVEGLHWARVHWLTSGALGVVVTLLGLWLQRRDRERTERHKAVQVREELLAEHCWMDPATNWLPTVSEVQDPVALGVHPATAVEDLDAVPEASGEPAALELPARVPVYVPRDLDAKLDGALAAGLARGGLVLVWGDSTAGKSRAAFQAMRRLDDDLWLLVPHHRGSLRALLDGGVELRDVVVWLNDLERYLGPGGLDVGLLRRLVGDGDRRVVVLATMRASEYNARSPERERDQAGPERDLLRAERELLDQAVDFELPRRFSGKEQERATERVWDPRIADALAHAGRFGLAEYLAAGPRLWRRWRGARALDSPVHEQVGAALVAAVLDCHRAGLSRPVSEELLGGLYRDPAYLDPPIARALDSAVFEEGLTWATKLVQGTSALLSPEASGYVVFDYLLDTVQSEPDAPAVPSVVWERLLRGLQADDALAVGFAAHQADEHWVAERAWQVAAEAGDHGAENNLGVLFQELRRVEEAERWYRRAAEAGEHPAENNLGNLLKQLGRLQEAERWYRRAAEAGHHDAESNLGILLKQLGRLEEAERWWRRAAEAGHHLAEYNLGNLLTKLGRLEEAERWLRRAAEAGRHDAQINLGNLLKQLGRLEEAEDWYRRAAEAGHHDAEYNLGSLLNELGQLEEAEDWYRRAAEAGHHLAENNLGVLLRGLGRLEEAERWLQRAAEAGHHNAEYNLGILLKQLGRLQEAERWYRRAADRGDLDAAQALEQLKEPRRGAPDDRK